MMTEMVRVNEKGTVCEGGKYTLKPRNNELALREARMQTRKGQLIAAVGKGVVVGQFVYHEVDF